MSEDFEIIVGTYEQFLLGYKIEHIGDEFKLHRSFATHSHQASVRSVASKKHYLASAGADDSVCLYDMRYRVESGRLTHHNDTVNCLSFTPDASHILTGSNDGSLAAVRCGNWQLEKHWRSAHKGSPVNSLSIHPSGKLALSVGGDGVLRTWNLIKGRQAYATNLVTRLGPEAKNITVLKWSPDGNRYLLAANNKLDLYSVESAGLLQEYSFATKVTCVEFINDNTVAIGHEDGKVRFYNVDKSLEVLERNAHDARVKCIAVRNNFLVTACSTGEIKLWRFGKKRLNLLATADCGARVTCLVLTTPCENLVVKKEEPKLEEAVQRKSNVFRIRQEVVIEDEGDVKEITNGSQVQKRRKSKKKKKGSAEGVEVKKRDKEAGGEEQEQVYGEEKKVSKRSFVEDNGEQKPKRNRVKVVAGEREEQVYGEEKKVSKRSFVEDNEEQKPKRNRVKVEASFVKDSKIVASSGKTKKKRQRVSGQNWEVEET